MNNLENFYLNDGIYFLEKQQDSAGKIGKKKWDEIASGWVKSGYGAQQPGGIWVEFPTGRHFETILDIGCGYGRHAMYLAQTKNMTCNNYYGIDISENMLRRLLQCKEELNFFPDAKMNIICMPCRELPLADNSVDFVMSSSVFMHLPAADVKTIMSEIHRVMKPGGIFIFNDSFHNKKSPVHVLDNVLKSLPLLKEKTSKSNQYSYQEIDQLIQHSQLPEKCPNYTIVPNHYEAVPVKIQKYIPLGEKLDQTLIKSASPQLTKDVLAASYTVYSDNFK
ncbi:MAG: class I SAM-dependent methyltransferase [Oscillatoria sp. PMC 1068.18]|nr:class I SAM-dependent methyltransferase [Oscillatoria sp. PMC 1068.18]